MAIVSLFSKRRKQLRGDKSDVYVYNSLPIPLRVQILAIWNDSLGNYKDFKDQFYPQPKDVYRFMVDTLRREYGVFALATFNAGESANYFAELRRFLLQEKDVERVLDAIELSFRYVDRITRNTSYLGRDDASKIATAAIAELNGRFREHGVGYSYEKGEIVRIDSQLLHVEVVKEALALLGDPQFKGAEQEFRSAHAHYRKGEAKEALNDALKALESTLKIICDLRSWPYDKDRATAKDLLDICFSQGLLPAFWQNTMGGLRALLENGVPTARNRLSGHGQGATPEKIPDHVVGYVLHMAASAVVFLAEAQKSTAPPKRSNKQSTALSS
jgi:hypothetical protein